MSSQDEREQNERATGLMHVLKSAFPAFHLSPWMSKHDKAQIISLAFLKNIGFTNRELDRRRWLDAHPEEIFYPDDSIETKFSLLKEFVSKHPENKEARSSLDAIQTEYEAAIQKEDYEPPEFDPAKMRGGSGMYAACIDDFVQNIHDMAPSEDGLRTRQAIGAAAAQKSGIAIQQEERTFWQKLTGKNKDKNQVSSGA